MDPNQLAPRIRVSKTFRLAATADLNGVGVNIGALLGLCGCIASTATTASPIAAAVKLSKVELWGVPATLGTSSTVSLTWSPVGETGLPVEQSDVSLSLSRPSHLVTAPPAQSLASFWHVQPVVDQNLFTFYLPQGGIMDITVQFQMRDTEILVPFAAVALAVNSMYYRNIAPTLKHVSLQSFD